MGFLENLRRQKKLAEAVEEVKRQSKLRKKADEENRLREEAAKRPQNFQLALEAKRQFDESGLRGLIGQLLDVKWDLKFQEPDWVKNYASLVKDPDKYYGDGKYSCEVILWEGTDYSKYHNDTKIKKYIGIVATHDGTITVTGNNKKSSSIVPKNLWKNNKPILENALGKAYTNPLKTIHSPSKSSETAGPGM